MSGSLLRQFETSDDAHVGQMLVRLARLAEAARQQAEAEALKTDALGDTSQRRVDGSDPISKVIREKAREGLLANDSHHMEVKR